MTSAPHTEAPRADGGPHRSLSGNLGTFSLVFMVIAAAAPLTVVGGTVPISFILGNGLGVPAMFLVATVILALFAVGLLAMSKRLPRAGAFFTYIAHGLGRKPGLSAAYLAILCYTTIQAAVFLLFGTTLSSAIAAVGGPEIAWWIFALAGVLLVGVLGYRRIELSSKVLFVALGLELLLGLVLVLAVLAIGGPEGVTFSSFSLESILSGSPGIGLMFAIAGFIGFESAVVFRNEVRDPDRTIPRATYAAAVIIGLFYALLSWIQIVAVGESEILDVAAADPANLLAGITDTYLGPIGSIAATVLMIGSMFAAVLALHTILARYFHNMSVTGLLPRGLGDVHPKHVSPYKAAITQVSIAAVMIVAVALTGVDPALALSWLTGMGTVAITLLMATTCVAAIRYLRRNPAGTSAWESLIAPGLGFLGLALSAALIIAYFPMLVGDVDADGAQFWGLASFITLGIVVAAMVFGWVQAARLKRRDPAAYEVIAESIESEA